MTDKYEIDGDVPHPEPDGSARFGPRPHELDSKAMNGLKSGLYANTLEAANALSPKYRPEVWKTSSKDQKHDYVKSKRKHFDRMLARLDPSYGY